MGSWWVQRPLATCLPSWPSITADWETGFSHQPAGRWRVSVWCLDATNIHFIDFSVPFCRAVGITEMRYMRYPDRHLKVLWHVHFSLPLFYIIYSSFFYSPFFFLCQTHIHTPRCPLGQSKIPFWPFRSINLQATSQLLPLAAIKDNTIISQLLRNPGKVPHLRFIGAHCVINRLKPTPWCSIDSSGVYLNA